ncbi:transposase [Metabacillus sp. KIGAM252]|uniref:Transposase n=1 Tax=Metabacillus flavus TaxID=2823519 RepID=A0ABS5L9I0_9BACI|nr:transposase [Metabacillus flavus]
MAKYSDQFKLMIVKEFQEGHLGYILLANKHGMPSSSPIKRWVKLYEKFGLEGLRMKHHLMSSSFGISSLQAMPGESIKGSRWRSLCSQKKWKKLR